MKAYELRVGKHALRQWRRLDTSIRKQFSKKLEKIVVNPHVRSARLHRYSNAYKVKLRKAGYRLAYRVFDDKVVVVVIAVGRRDKNEVYEDFAPHYYEGEP